MNSCLKKCVSSIIHKKGVLFKYIFQKKNNLFFYKFSLLQICALVRAISLLAPILSVFKYIASISSMRKDIECIGENINISKDLMSLAHIFNRVGFSVYLVGGALRDSFLQRDICDIDIATDATPQDVIKLFRKTIPTGIKHGTVTIIFRGRMIECTTLRRDEGYEDARHPDKVIFGNSIIEDLSRRDFTMNAIAARLPDATIIDPYGGKKDIKRHIICAVGVASKRFEEDTLRPVRAIRFVSQLGFNIEEQTLKAIPPIVPKMKNISIERFQDEFNKMIMGKYFDKAFTLMYDAKIFNVFISELELLQKEDKNLLLKSISNIPCTAFILRLSIICYYIANKNTQNYIEKIRSILKRLKYSNNIISHILHILPYCYYDIEKLDCKVKMRFFVKDAKKEYIKDIFILKKALSSNENSLRKLVSIEKNIREMMLEDFPHSIKELCINGDDLLSIGIKKGPIVGKLLNKLLDIVLEEPSKNNKEELTKIAVKLAREF